LRVGIDHRPALYGRGGLAVYVRELVLALARAYPDDRLELFGHRLRGRLDGEAPALPAHARLHRRRIPVQALGLFAALGRGADRLLGGVDVLHLTDFAPLRSSRAPVVATIHDVLFAEHPDWYDARTVRRLHRATARLVAAAAAVLVPSDRSRDALMHRFGVDSGRVHLVPLAGRTLPAAEPAREHGAYVLFVGTLQPRKNLARLVEAFDAVHRDHGEWTLVVAGARGWLDGGLLEGMARRPHVVYEGMVDLQRLAALYAGAEIVALPSLAEGFGLPVLEAMAHGKPVLVGKETTCADLAGEAGMAVAARDAGAIESGLNVLLSDAGERARRGEAGRGRAAAFTWERTARLTHAVYEQVVGA
jgi:glycosyltransferase involved in cell wall biosynthesis